MSKEDLTKFVEATQGGDLVVSAYEQQHVTGTEDGKDYDKDCDAKAQEDFAHFSKDTNFKTATSTGNQLGACVKCLHAKCTSIFMTYEKKPPVRTDSNKTYSDCYAKRISELTA